MCVAGSGRSTARRSSRVQAAALSTAGEARTKGHSGETLGDPLKKAASASTAQNHWAKVPGR
jgi:hypothetical protein